MNPTTKAWIEAAPRIAHMLHKHSDYPNAMTAEGVIWLSLLMMNNKLPWLRTQQYETGKLLVKRYMLVATKMGIIADDPELYDPTQIQWSEQLEAKALAAFMELNNIFDGPVMEH